VSVINLGAIEAVLRLRDEISTRLPAVQASLQRAGRTMTEAGLVLSAGVTAPLVGVGIAAVRAGMDFEKAMNSITGVLRPTAAEMQTVRETAIEMGQATAFSATESATAIFELGKAGFTTTEAIEAVDDVLQLAAASGLSMGESAELAARTLNAFGLETADLAHVNDVLAKAVNSSSLEILDLQTAFKYVGPIAQGFGMSIEQTTAALALMRDAGIAAETSGRALREGLSRLANPVKSVEEVMAELGISSFKVGGELMNLSQIVEVLRARNISAAQALKLFGDAAGPAMFALVTQGRGALDDMTRSLESSEGAAKAMADAMMKGLPGAFERTRGSIETARIALSKALEPALVSVLGWIERAADAAVTAAQVFSQFPMPVQATAVAFTAIATLAGPVLFFLGGVSSGVSSLIGLFKLLTGAQAAATATTTAATTATSALGVALGFAAKAASLFGAAVAGWTIGTWIADLRLFGDTAMSIGESFEFGATKLLNWMRGIQASDADIEAAIVSRRTLKAATDELSAATAQVAATHAAAVPAVAALTGVVEAGTVVTERARDWWRQLQEQQFEAIRVNAEAAAAWRRSWDERERAIQVAALTISTSIGRMINETIRASNALRGLTADGLIPTIEVSDELQQAALRAGQGMDFMAKAVAAAQRETSILISEAQKASGVLGSFFGGIRDGIKSLWEGMSGDKGLAGLFRNLGDGIVEGFGRIISGGITDLMNSALSVAMKGLSKLWGWVKGMFGPSRDEREARSVFDEWSRGLQLTADQVAEVQQAVSQGWQEHLAIAAIAIRDAYLLTGRSAEEASAVTQRLFDATRVSGAAVQAVLREIEVVMREAYQQSAQVAADTATAGFDRTTGAIQETITTLKGLTNEEYAALKTRSTEILTLVHGLWTEAHNATLAARNAVDAVIDALIRLMHGASEALTSVHDQLLHTRNAADALAQGIAAVAAALNSMPREITTVHTTIQRTVVSGEAGPGTDEGEHSTGEGPRWSDERRERFIANNGPEDLGRWDGYRHGTPGLDFMPFGAGRSAMLHGDEAVIPKGSGHQLAAEIAEALGGRGGRMEIHVHTHLDGREVAHTIVPYWSRALSAHGLA